MKRFPPSFPNTASLAILLAVAPVVCTAQSDAARVPAAPSNLTVRLVASNDPNEGVNPFVHTATAGNDITAARWTDIKDNTFEERALFLAGLTRLQARVDLQMSELSAKRATLESVGAETQSWDSAMREMENARSYLKSMGEEAGTATPDNWDPVKLKVGSAWLRTQNAYAKVKLSTTY